MKSVFLHYSIGYNYVGSLHATLPLNRVDAGIMRHENVNFYNSQMKCGKATQLGLNKLYFMIV